MSSTLLGTVTPPRHVFDREVEELRDDGDTDGYDGWFCIRTVPFPCPAAGCTFVADFMTAAHLIVVWPRDDDPKLLGQARNAREAGRRPRVVPYERSFGNCIPIDVWLRMGRPIHGQRPEPDGWNDRTGPNL